MKSLDRKKHWENIYETTDISTKSWYQPIPHSSLTFIEETKCLFSAKIIDIGGGDSYLVDNLLERGYENITVVDISAAAIEKVKKRLGSKADKVDWIVSDITDFTPTEKYDVWHDRAAFHFLTNPAEVQKYVQIVRKHLTENGILILGTFSMDGPKKCSGLEIQQYSDVSLTEVFAPWFETVKCEYIDHKTPSGAIQNFVFCQFIRK